MRAARPDAAPPIHRSFLRRRDGLYASAALVLAAASILLYVGVRPRGPPNGGSFTGYALGIVGLLLIVWLSWFGIRRKRYGERGLLADWLSAHVYLGSALAVVALLHAGFRFHYNIHTLAFFLMAAVIASGAFGVYAYWRYPALATANRQGATLNELSSELAALDLQCRELAAPLDAETVRLVFAATGGTFRRTGLRDMLIARSDPLTGATGAALNRLGEVLGGQGTAAPRELLSLVDCLTRRAALVVRLRRDLRFRSLMLLWRAVHVPLTIALLVALAIHVFAVFYYW
jgi:hypothetical protein